MTHVLVGMGWISNTIWFIAQSFVEQLHLERLDMLHGVAVLSPAWLASSVRYQSHGVHCMVRYRETCAKPALDVFSALPGIYTFASHSKWTCSGSAVSAQCQSQPWGRQLKVWGLSFWSVLLSLVVAGTSGGHDLCNCPCVSPEDGYAQVQWKLTFYLPAFPRHFQEIKPSKTWCGHNHRVITVPLKLYWVYRYTYLYPSVNPTICFQALKLQDIFYICYWEQMCPNPIIFYWRMSGLWEVEWWMPFNLNYYFLHSIATAGRLQLLIETLKIFIYITDQNLSCTLSFPSF